MSFTANAAQIHDRIARICRDYGCDVPAPRLIAVSKTQTEAAIQEALDAGHRLFGENKVQEAQAHWAALKPRYPDLRLHLIGPLQTNKADAAVELFDVIETLDRENLADALSRAMEKKKRRLPCFIQVNTGAEPQKAGVTTGALPALLSHARARGLEVTGLMCIPPADEPAALHFALLKKLAARHGLDNLSMGMSADFDKAAALGAHFIRVGTALFGERS